MTRESALTMILDSQAKLRADGVGADAPRFVTMPHLWGSNFGPPEFSLFGMGYYPCKYLSETKVIAKRPRKWARRKQYQPWREFDLTYGEVAQQRVIKMGSNVFAHPDMLAKIKATAIEAGKL